jgi:hypothetical protein
MFSLGELVAPRGYLMLGASRRAVLAGASDVATRRGTSHHDAARQQNRALGSLSLESVFAFASAPLAVPHRILHSCAARPRWLWLSVHRRVECRLVLHLGIDRCSDKNDVIEIQSQTIKPITARSEP